MRAVPAEFDRRTHTDSIDALFGYIEGDIWLLDQLGGYYDTLKRLQVGQPKPDVQFLADMKHVSATQDARQSLFDVLKCTALKNHPSSKHGG